MRYAKWIFVLMLILIPAIAAAQMPVTERIAAQVPFTFVVANHVIPLGECTIQAADPTGRVLVVRSPNAGVNLFATASPKVEKKAAKAYSLVFHRYGGRYYLAAVKLESSRVVYWVTPSSFEKEALAMNGPANEQVLLASIR